MIPVIQLNKEWPTPTYALEEYEDGRVLFSNNYIQEGATVEISGKQFRVIKGGLAYHNPSTGYYGFIYALRNITKP